MKILIIEDEVPAFRRLQKLIEEIKQESIIVEVLDGVESSIKWLNNHPVPDLIFMDIQLSDGLSFEIFEQIEIQAPIIFTTAYDEYTLKAFKVNSIDYLLKPIDKEELKRSIHKLERLQTQFSGSTFPLDISSLIKSLNVNNPSYKSRFLVKRGDKLATISEESIAYFYTEDKVVFLLTQYKEKYIVDYSLEELEQLLDPEFFFRLNRQVIARLQAIESIHQYFKGKLAVKLQPKTFESIIVSRERSNLFKQWLDK